MLIDFRMLWPKYGIKPKGVLHIGANVGEEAPVYLELGVTKQLWIEANHLIFETLQNNIKPNSDAHAICAVISDKIEQVKFNISSNASQSSSILELGTHKTVHPEVSFVRSEERWSTTIAEIYEQDFIEPDDYDFLNIDLQGTELKALKGMGGIINNFKWAYLEVNKAELYIGCALIEEIDAYLLNYGFVRVETQWAGNTNWGDALYIKIK